MSTQNRTEEEGVSWESDVSQLLGFRVNICRLPPSEKEGKKSSVAHKDGKFPRSNEFFFSSSKLFPSQLSPHQLTSLSLLLRPASSNLSFPPQTYSLFVLRTQTYCLHTTYCLDTLSPKHQTTCPDAHIPYSIHHKYFELMPCIPLTRKRLKSGGPVACCKECSVWLSAQPVRWKAETRWSQSRSLLLPSCEKLPGQTRTTSTVISLAADIVSNSAEAL